MSQPRNQTQVEIPDYGAPPIKPAAPEPEPARLGPWQRLIGTLFSPGETFQDVNRKPTWLIPMLVTMVVATAFMMFFNSQTDEGWRQFMTQQMRGSGAPSELTPQQLDATVKIMQWAYVGGALLVTPVYYLIIAGAFALSLMIMQAQTTFKKILSVVAWSACGTGIIQAMVHTASLVARDADSLSRLSPKDLGTISATNLAVALPSGSSQGFVALAASIDIFSIWFLILLVIGFTTISATKRITRGKVAGLVVGLWIVSILIRVVGASLAPS